MAKVSDVAAYFCRNYPHKEELSKTRLTKLVYLADWESAKRHKKQITPIQWYFHNFGPYVDTVFNEASSDPRFKLTSTRNYYGDTKTIIGLKRSDEDIPIPSKEREILDSVIEDTSKLYWDNFIKHVYRTPPIAKSNRYQVLNLEKIAVEQEKAG